EFVGMPAGRYHMTVINPQEPSQFIDPVDADTSRSAGNRLLIHLYLRTPSAEAKRASKPGVVTVAEGTQQVPRDARRAFEEAVKLRRENQTEKAAAKLERAIELYPEYFQALAERGELHISKGRIAEAAKDFDSALKLNEDYAPALRGAGYCRLEQQHFEDAIAYLERAIAIEPNVTNSHLFLGIASLAVNRREKARQELQSALKLDAERAATAHI